MANGRPSRVRRVGYQEEPEPPPAPATDSMRILAGIGAILFPVLNVLRFGAELYNLDNALADLLLLLAYFLLLPLVYVLYEELRAVSQGWSVVVSIPGAGMLVAITLEVSGGPSGTTATTITVGCMSLWIGLAGCVAATRGIFGAGWESFSIGVGAIALVTALLPVVPVYSATILIFIVAGISYILALAIWFVWTGVLFIQRGRVTPTGHSF
ncbi:MAG: hypothetical protein M3437_14640 [Chloroflexota bacterium]|nr:hypothetical protein [Chloroflexota bacterium]MDQ5865570.1 hypothetical protein [Chloroflexota bacterium]